MLANTGLLLHTELQSLRMDPIIMHLHVNTYMMELKQALSNVCDLLFGRCTLQQIEPPVYYMYL